MGASFAFWFWVLYLHDIGGLVTHHTLVATTVELILMAIVSPKLQGAWPELLASNRKVSLLQSSVFAGELLGGLIWGTLSDKLGRRGTFMGTAVMASIFATLAAFSPSYWAFVICRFALGIAIGIIRITL
jgi:MFS family permease